MTWTPDIVIYHDKCIDGFTAAWCCWQRWPHAGYFARNYGMPVDLEVDGKRILIVDFSYPAEILNGLIGAGANSIVILDHHKSAEEELTPFRRYADKPERFTLATATTMIEDLQRGGYPPICALFDMQRSGGGLAWDFAHETVRPLLVDLVEDRDLWRFRFGESSRNLHLALSTRPKDFETWTAASDEVQELLNAGRAIASYRDTLIEEIADRAWVTQIDGKPVITVDCPYLLVSETAHRLLQLHPDAAFAAMRVAGEHSITFSLRSEDDREDVSAIARKFGGGGHRNASGFRVPA